MTSRQLRVPSFRHHKASNQGFVEIAGKRHYLGVFGKPETREAYNRIVGQWLSAGRELPAPAMDDLTIVELIDRFWTYAERFYVDLQGEPTTEQAAYRQALKPLREMYGHSQASTFGPKALQLLQGEMIRRGWNRRYLNSQVGRIKRVFRWAASQELVPASVYHGLEAVDGLRAGKTDAREGEPVGPVPMALVDAIRPFVSRQVWGLIQLQLCTGARPGELLKLRRIDIDTSGKVWTAALSNHKNTWRGHRRQIAFGPRAQGVLAEFLTGRKVDAYLFSPREAYADHQAARASARVTPMNEGNKPGSNVVEDPEWQPGEFFTSRTYGQAIKRACDKAFPFKPGAKGDNETPEAYKARVAAEREAWQHEHRWHPHQLRHNAAVAARREYGPDAARAMLGHRSLGATAIYAEVDGDKVAEIVAKIG